MDEHKNLAFVSEEFKAEEVILKGAKKYFVEGYVSTVNEDLAGEIVTDAAQDDLVQQLVGRDITMDIEHEEWYDEKGQQLPRPKNQLIPVAKIIKAERRKSPKNGTWVKAEINSNLGAKFKAVWGSIMDGFLKAFSIAFYPVEAVTRRVGGKLKTWINKLNIVNITLTGSPILPDATFVPVMKSALKNMGGEFYMDSKLKDEKEEVEEQAEEQPEQKQEEPKEEEKQEEKPEEKEEPEEKEPEKKEVDTHKADIPDRKPLDLIKAFKKEKVELEKKIDDASAKIKAQETEIAELKAKLEKPILKAKVEEMPSPQGMEESKNPLDKII